MTAPILATRVRKARGESVCGWPGCTVVIRLGNQIGRVDGYGWCHVQCIIDGQRQRRARITDPENT